MSVKKELNTRRVFYRMRMGLTESEEVPGSEESWDIVLKLTCKGGRKTGVLATIGVTEIS